MNYIGVVLFGIWFIFGFYISIKQILIGKKIIKSKRYSEEKDLKRLFIRGLVGLILEILILGYLIIGILIASY